MNTRTDHPLVIDTINTLNGLVPFGFKHNGNFIPVNNISIDMRGKLYYLDNNNHIHSVSSLIKDVTGLQTVRWLNHIQFRDGFGNEKSLKTYISQKHNLIFT